MQKQPFVMSLQFAFLSYQVNSPLNLFIFSESDKEIHVLLCHGFGSISQETTVLQPLVLCLDTGLFLVGENRQSSYFPLSFSFKLREV